VEVLLGSLSELPPSADDAIQVNAKSSGGYTLLAHSRLPEGATDGDTLLLDTWWRADADTESRLVLVYACHEGGCVKVPLSNPRPLGAPGSIEAVDDSGGKSASAIVFRQRIPLPIHDFDKQLTLALAVADPLEWNAATQQPQRSDIDLATSPWLDHWSSVEALQQGTDANLPDTLLPVASILIEPETEKHYGCLIPAAYNESTAVQYDASFGDLARLVDVWTDQPGVPWSIISSLSSLRPESTLRVQLEWLAFRSDSERWRVSLQLLDADGHPVAQSDAEPGNWDSPTTEWRAGQYICDPHDLQLPADLPSGRYRLVAALYHPRTGWRLPVSGEDSLGDMALLGVVTVSEFGEE
jgi:hypothetical protein